MISPPGLPRYVQRRELRSSWELHPLLTRIMRIHVTEEARHLSFARHYLKRTASLGKVAKLCDELGLTAGPYRVLWRRLGLDVGTGA